MQTQNTRRSIARRVLPALACALFLPGAARADYQLWDWSTILDGAIHDAWNGGLPASVNSAGFNFATGKGSLVFTFNTPGAHNGGVYLYSFWDDGNWSNGQPVDHSSAYGSVVGALPSGVSYELNWPGYLNPAAPPTVFDDFSANNLQNTNGVGAFSPPPTACCSVAMALIANFTLGADETALLTFTTTDTAPAGGFYLKETDQNAGTSFYLAQDLQITTTVVPEPATFWLLLAGCGGVLYGIQRKRTTRGH